jgi:hypothetical protein
MKISFLIFMLSGLLIYGQTPTYYHDPSLDSINGQVGNVDADLNGYLSQQLTISNVNNYGVGSVSNYPSTITNVIGPASSTNTSAISNAWATVLGGLSLTNAFNTNSTSANTNSVIDLGTFNGQDFTMDFSSNSLTSSQKSVMSFIYNITLSFIYLFLFIFSFSYLQKDFLASMNQRQMSGLTQSIFGFNASAPTALIYCALIVSALVAMLSLVVTNGFIKLALQASLAIAPQLSLFTALPGWDVLILCFPITQAMSAYFTYLAFRYIFAYPLFLVVRCVQLFLIR